MFPAYFVLFFFAQLKKSTQEAAEATRGAQRRHYLYLYLLSEENDLYLCSDTRLERGLYQTSR